MKRIVLATIFALTTLIGIYTYSNSLDKEVSQIAYLKDNISKGYEDIIIKKEM